MNTETAALQEKQTGEGDQEEGERYLVCHAWGLGNTYEARLTQLIRDKEVNDSPQVSILLAEGGDDDDEYVTTKTFVNNIYFLIIILQLKQLYIINYCRTMAEDNLNYVTAPEFIKRKMEVSSDVSKLLDDEVAYWEMKRRSHLLHQEHISSHIADSLRRNPKRS